MGRHFRGRVAFVAAASAFALGVELLGQIPPPPPPPPPPPATPPAATGPVSEAKGAGFVTGRVVDASSGRPVSGVAVSISGTAATTVLPTGEIVMVNPALTANPAGAPRQVLTDSQGRYVFHDLAKGRYTIRTTASGYVFGGFGQTRPNGPTQQIELVDDNSRLGDLTIRIWKNASIAGTVLDESGEPVVGLSLSAFRRTLVNGLPRLSTSGSAVTDDRGMYRLSGVVPGEYVVGVMSSQTTMAASTADAYIQAMSLGGSAPSDFVRELQNSGAPFPSVGGYRVGDFYLQGGNSGRGGAAAPAPTDDQRVFVYPSTFYPAAASFEQATILKLASGEEREGIDLQLKLAPTVRVSGVVTGPDGPVRNIGVRLIPAASDALSGFISNLESATGATDASGAFTLLGVTPGQYTLKVMRVPRPVSVAMPANMTSIEVSGPAGQMMGISMSGGGSTVPPPLPAEPTIWANVPVSVSERDPDGITVTLRPGIRVSGRLQFEGTKSPPAADQLQRASIVFTSPEPRGSGLLTPLSRVEADGRFGTTGYPPGRYQITATIPAMTTGPQLPGVGSGWTFKSAMLNGRNLADDPLVLESEDVSGVVITFTDRTTQLSGSVVNASGQPDKAADVVIFPADSQGWRQGLASPRRIRTARASLTGTYEFTNLPAGEYFAIAVGDEGLGDTQDPKFLESLVGGATRVTVADGEKKTQNLVTVRR